jgi:CheY-like chemotaxis protein
MDSGYIWLIESDPEVAVQITDLLAGEGFLVETFNSADDLWSRLTSCNGTRVLLALIDIHLIDSSGPALGDRLKARCADTNILYLSARIPRPVVPGAQVLGLPIENQKEFLATIWGHCKTAISAQRFSRFESTVLELVGTLQTGVQTVDQRTVCLESRVSEIRGACAQHMANVSAQIEGIKLPDVTSTWLSRMDPITKRVISGLCVVLVALGGLIGRYMYRTADEAQARLLKVSTIQDKLDREIEPAVRSLEQSQKQLHTGLNEVLRRLPAESVVRLQPRNP